MQDEEKPQTQTYSGFIIVRLAEGGSLEKTDNLRKVAKSGFPGLASFLDRHKEIVTRRLIRSVDPKKMLEMEQKARFSKFAPLHSLTCYWRLDCRMLEYSLEEILRTLRNRSDVELAYAERIVLDPTVNPDDPFNPFQGYLDPAPDGIDARWVWTQANGEGAGIGFVDLEQGWFLAHEDLIAKSPTSIFNDNRDGVRGYRGNHGTAVLGEVVATDNSVGIVGIAPGVTSVRVTSHYERATYTSLHVADAIVAATEVMAPGDVLLLEVERASLPTETDPGDFTAIRLATASGIIVIEAAGNAGRDLDAWVGVDGRRFDRTPANDSGAIMVGACRSATRNRHLLSNFGARLDCFAWGDSIATLGYGDLTPGAPDNSTYTLQFDKTSGAAPIVAGAALLVQGMYQAAPPVGGRLSPSQMRALLSNPATGTRQGPDVPGFIGIMPNLRAILRDTLGLAPDLYLRDFVGDTGVIPSTGAISASPDIIVRSARVADPNASFGEGSGTENSDSLSSEVEAGQDSFIYVRMRNRSNTAGATNATVTVYWSEVSTLVTPDLWHRIGETAPVNVPAGDTFVVAGPITWRAADIPATGHYCFVGVINQARDLAPVIPPAIDWDGFSALIRNNNNVTWRNFNVIDEVADSAVQTFMIAGAPDSSRVFDLEVIQRLPEKAHVVLEMPMQLFVGFPRDTFLRVELNPKEQVARVSLPKRGGVQMGTMKLKKAARHRCRLIVTGLKGKKALGHSVAIRQVCEGQEVGRITWVFRHKRLGLDP